MAELPKDAAAAVAWAKAAINSGESFPGLCDHFAGLAFGLAHSGYETATQHWEQSPDKHTDNRPDVGSLVFFKTGQAAGHVAIVTGYDKQGEPLIVTTHTNGGKPTEMRLADTGLDYEGWTAPVFQDKTTKTIKPADVPKATVAPVNPNPGDTSGTQPVGGISDMTQDKLTKKSLAESYAIPWSFVQSHDDVFKVFQNALDPNSGYDLTSDIGKQNFINDIQGTSWYQQNDQYAREYLFNQQALSPADKATQQESAVSAVQAAAANVGAVLTPDQAQEMAKQYLINGWGKSGRTQYLQQALTGNLAGFDHSYLDYSKGGAAALVSSLKKTASDNGVTFDNSYYTGAANAILGGLTTADTYVNEIRGRAASMYPMYGDRVLGGENVTNIGSPARAVIADTLELDPSSIGLDNKWMQMALQASDDKGNPVPQSLFTLRQDMMKSDEFKNTQQYADKFQSYSSAILQKLGLGG